MMVEDLSAFLQADAGITTLAAGRVYPQSLPQKATLPALVYQQIAGKTDTTLENAAQLADELFQIACMAMSYKEAKQLSEKVRQALEGFKGTMGATVILGIFAESERDFYDPEQLEYRTDLDFKIWHREP